MSNKSWRKRWIYDSDVSVPRTSKWRRKNEEIQGEDDDADLRQKTTSMHEITDLRENISPLKQRKILPSCSVREEQLEKREHTQKSSLCDPIINSSNTKFNATKHFIQGSQPTCNLIEEGGSSMDNIDYENFDIAAISASAGSVALDVQTSKDLIDQITWQNTVYEEELDNEEANVQPNDDQCLPDIEGGPLIDNINLKEDIPDMKSFSTHIQNQEETIENESLYDNSTLKTDESSLLIMAFAVRHKLSGVALEDLLKLIELHCPKPNKCTTEIKEFKMFFQALKHPIVYHYYCPNTVCQNYTGTSVPIESDKCEVCETYLSKSAYFIEIPIKEQIKTIFSRKEMLEKLHYRFQREKDDDSIEDVFDGELYKMHFSPGKFLWDPHNISLLGNTDGVALIKSTSYGVWPVYFVINELPPKERIRRSNRIFSGLWFGKGKPHFPTFLRPFSMSLRNLYFKGVRITDTIMMKAIVLEMSVDSPARAVWQAIKQFNGYHGCGKCKEPGEQLDLGPGKGKSRRSSHIYPFNKEFAATTGHKGLRSHDEVKKQALEAIRNKPHNKKFAVEGVVGLSWGFGLPMFDVIKGTVVDYMHCVCEGVVDQLLSKWLNKTNSKEAFYLGNKIDQISKELKAIRPTLEITRTPRSLADVKQWKASEKRAFLLYYSVPLLSPYLSSDYLHSLMMLSGGVFRLLKQSISRSDIEEASTYLRLFTALAPVYYGKQFQTFNVHQLLHLPEVVKDAGPLWSNSCFPFEDYNGDLRDLFHGSNNVDGQIVTAVSVTQKLPEIAQATTTSSEVRAFYDHLTSKRSNACSLKDKIEENAHVLGSLERVWGTTSSKLLSEKQMAAIPKHHGKLWVFRRCFIGGVIFHSKSYKRVVARNDFTVKCRQGEEELYGSVDTYVKLEEKCMNARCIDRMCTCHLSSRYVAIIEVLESHVEQLPRYRERTVVNHIIRVNPTNRLIAVPVTNILEKFIKVDVPSGSFICLLPNHYEKD